MSEIALPIIADDRRIVETGETLIDFEELFEPKARVPVPYYHESWDEAVYGLSGTLNFRVGGDDQVNPSSSGGALSTASAMTHKTQRSV